MLSLDEMMKLYKHVRLYGQIIIDYPIVIKGDHFRTMIILLDDKEYYFKMKNGDVIITHSTRV